MRRNVKEEEASITRKPERDRVPHKVCGLQIGYQTISFRTWIDSARACERTIAAKPPHHPRQCEGQCDLYDHHYPKDDVGQPGQCHQLHDYSLDLLRNLLGR